MFIGGHKATITKEIFGLLINGAQLEIPHGIYTHYLKLIITQHLLLLKKKD